MNIAPTLRPYQRDALQAIDTARLAGTNRVLVQSPTGTGKTVTFAEVLNSQKPWLDTLPKRGARLLVIAHREELLDQAAAKIQAANPGLVVTVEQGDRVAHRLSDVVVASIQTLAATSFRRLHRLIALHAFNIVIIDEAHHAAASTYRGALVHLGFLPPAVETAEVNTEGVSAVEAKSLEESLAGWDAVAPKDRLLIGVTATPNRSDAIGLGCVFQTIAYSYRLKDAIADKWLVDITPWAVDTDANLDNVKITAGEYNQKQLADAVNTHRRNLLAVASWKQYAPGRPTIAFAVDVAHAKDLAAAFLHAGVRANFVSGDTPKDERATVLRQFRDGQLDVVTNCMILTEGTDLPIASCILHAKPTRSATLYEQMTGRGLRLYPGKDDCVVIDLVDVARRHSLQTAPVLYGLPPQLAVKGKSLKKVEEEYEALLDRYKGFDASIFGRVTLDQLRAKAELVNIWEVQEVGPAFGLGRALDWTRTGDAYRLTYPWLDGSETLQVSSDLIGKWEIVATFRNAAGEKRQRTVAQGIDQPDRAASIAEAYVLADRATVKRLVGKDEPWRAKPATDKQINLLRTLRVQVKHGLTSGDASKLITLAKEQKAGAR